MLRSRAPRHVGSSSNLTSPRLSVMDSRKTRNLHSAVSLSGSTLWRHRRLVVFVTLLCATVWLMHRELFISSTIRLTPSPDISDDNSKDELRKEPKIISSVGGDPQRVDRTIMAKLHELQSEDPDNNRYPVPMQEPLHYKSSPRHWPPIVSVLPDSRVAAEVVEITSVHIPDVDAQFCGTSPCRLLLPLWIGEQESNARAHLVQIRHLAAMLNRTLVLPNVGRSRIGTCFRWEFQTYYDLRSVVNTESTPRVAMLMEDFKTWTNMRPRAPTAQIIAIEDRLSADSTKALHITINTDSEAALRSARCITHRFRRLILDAFSPVTVNLRITPTDILPGTLLIDALTDSDLRNLTRHFDYQDHEDPDLTEPLVLLLHWDLRHPPFTRTTGLDYAPALWALSRRLTATIGSYLAVHWRMETVEPAALPACASALIDTLVMVLTDAGVQTVWFASDYPFAITGGESEERRSNTFRTVGAQHVRAIEIVRNAFAEGGTLASWHLTGIAEELGRVRAEDDFDIDDWEEAGLLEDMGVLGILDKMIAMKAQLFVSGAKGCGRVSSFTKQIVEFREQMNAGDVPINIVELFG